MDEYELAEFARSIMDEESNKSLKGDFSMDEVRISEQAEELLRGKLDELSYMDIENESFKDAADGINKVADAYTKLKQEERNKKEGFFKVAGIIAGVLTGIGAALVKGLCDAKINERNLSYLDMSHEKAYAFEKEGETNHIVVSPASKDALRESPKSLR